MGLIRYIQTGLHYRHVEIKLFHSKN